MGSHKYFLLISSNKQINGHLRALLENKVDCPIKMDQIDSPVSFPNWQSFQKYDLILLHSKDEEFCVQTTKQLRKNVPQVPIILLGPIDELTAGRASASGAHFVLSCLVNESDYLVEIFRATIRRERMESELYRQDEIFQAVNYAAEIFFTQPSWEPKIADVLSRLGYATDSQRVYLLESIREELGKESATIRSVWVERGFQPPKCKDIKNMIGVYQKPLQHGDLVYQEVENLPSKEAEVWQKNGVLSYILLPVFVNHIWWGVIGLEQHIREYHWTHVEVNALRTAANILGAAISHQVDREKLTYLATHDYLTKLPNRMLLEDRFKRAVARAGRSGKKIAVICIDLDKFKQVNDTWGHPVGDSILMEIARRFNGTVRTSDTCARIGGDEFGVIAEGIHNHQDAMRVMEKLDGSLIEPFVKEGQSILVRASMGAALFPDAGNMLEELMRVADLALYDTKKSTMRYKVYQKDQYSLLEK